MCSLGGRDVRRGREGEREGVGWERMCEGMGSGRGEEG